MAHQKTHDIAAQVETMAAFGVPQDDIAKVIGITGKTLRRHYRNELDTGSTKANAKVAESLFRKATSGNVTAAIFWLKTRMGWKETSRFEHDLPKDLKITVEGIGPDDE